LADEHEIFGAGPTLKTTGVKRSSDTLRKARAKPLPARIYPRDPYAVPLIAPACHPALPKGLTQASTENPLAFSILFLPISAYTQPPVLPASFSADGPSLPGLTNSADVDGGLLGRMQLLELHRPKLLDTPPFRKIGEPSDWACCLTIELKAVPSSSGQLRIASCVFWHRFWPQSQEARKQLEVHAKSSELALVWARKVHSSRSHGCCAFSPAASSRCRQSPPSQSHSRFIHSGLQVPSLFVPVTQLELHVSFARMIVAPDCRAKAPPSSPACCALVLEHVPDIQNH